MIAVSAREYLLPDLGEGLTEAELVSWSVAAGDTVTLNQTVAEVETAKATVELPSPFAGTVLELLAAAGEVVPVGAPLIRIDDGESTGHDGSTEHDTDSAPATSVLVGYGPQEAEAPRRTRRPVPEGPHPAGHEPEMHTGEVVAKPAARLLARELGVDLADVPGSGHGGAVTPDDVRAAASSPPTTAARSPSPAPDARETRVPVRGVRRETAAAMVRSAFTAPHVTEFVTVDVSASMDLLDRLRGTPDLAGLPVTPLPLVARAMVGVLRRHPEPNSTWDEARAEIVTHHHVDLGIATATERGLLVPTVRDAHTMGLVALTRAIADAVAAARTGTATPADLTGSTITITNVGVFGVDAGTPILPPGQAAIVCLGAIARRPWVVDEVVVPRWVTTLGLSFDHRVLDGAQASRFLAAIGAALTDPPLMLADS